MVILHSKWCIRFLSVMVISMILFYGVPLGVKAHMSTVGYSDIAIEDKTIHYRLYLDPVEVAQWVDSQSSGVFVIGEPTKDKAPQPEVKWTDKDLLPLIQSFLSVSNNGKTVDPSIQGISIEKRDQESYVLINIHYVFPQLVDSYEIKYHFFFDQFDELHQNFSTINIGDTQVEKVFNKNNRLISGKVESMSSGTITTEVSIPGWLNTMYEYVHLGLEHIWTGYDHLVFVAALVLLRQSIVSYIKILTAFTIGHSITIAIAALGIISIPASIVEPLIALSIVYVAVENIWLKKLQWRWLLALGFGLIHGFGFAQVLQGSLGEQYILSLFSFNLGVEIGQIAVLAVLLPILILVSRWKWYLQAAYSLSAAIGVVGLYWLIERTLF